MQMKIQHAKSMECSKSGTKWEIYSSTGLPQEKLRISNKLTSHLKGLEEEEHVKPKVIRWKEKINITAEVNKIETKRTIEKFNEMKSWFFER